MGCSIANETYYDIRQMRENMCVALNRTLYIQDPTIEVVYARIVGAYEILHDLTQISNTALDACTNVLLTTLEDSSDLVIDDEVLPIMIEALSHVLKMGLALDDVLKTKIVTAIDSISIIKQQNLILGQEGITTQNEVMGRYISKVRFGGGRRRKTHRDSVWASCIPLKKSLLKGD